MDKRYHCCLEDPGKAGIRLAILGLVNVMLLLCPVQMKRTEIYAILEWLSLRNPQPIAGLI